MNKEQKNIYVKTLELAGIAPAFKAMRLPMKSEDKSDSHFDGGFLYPSCYEYSPPYKYRMLYGTFGFIRGLLIGKKDISLLQRLVLSGDEHAKAVRGIMVWAEMNLPRYVWQEMDTYTVGVIPLSSESTMHCEAKGLTEEELVKFKESLPEGHVQKRIRAFSYQTLRRMYFQRRNHRLPIWRNIIIPWIESLPLSAELITVERRSDVTH